MLPIYQTEQMKGQDITINYRLFHAFYTKKGSVKQFFGLISCSINKRITIIISESVSQPTIFLRNSV